MFAGFDPPEHDNMNTISTESLIQQLNWRYATKKFDPARKIEPGQWAALEQALILSPSSFGLQPWKFIVVNDPATRKALQPHSWGQSQVVDASHMVVFTIRTDVDAAFVDKFIQRTAELRGMSADALKGYRDLIVGFIGKLDAPGALQSWATRQAYIALGNFMTSAAVLGVDVCPMEGIDPSKYDELLGLRARNLSTVVVAAAGFRAGDDKYATLPKVRFAEGDVLERI